MTNSFLALLAGTAMAMSAPDFKLKVKNGQLIATPPAKHHINVPAPMSFTWNGVSAKPVRASEKEAVFVVPSGSGKFSVSLFLCDDKKTFCEKHTVSGQLKDGAIIGKVTADNAPETPTQSAPTSAKPDSHGFIVNAPDAALELAKKSKKPLLIDFFGIWCPPCNELDAKVWPSSVFQKASAGFVKLKLDVDSEVSFALKSRYKIGGYPTVILADSNGDEISRIVGFGEPDIFSAKVSEAYKLRDTPAIALKAKAEKGDRAAADRLGVMHLERREFADAAKYLEKSVKHREQWFAAEIGKLEGKPEAAAVMEKRLAEFPSTPDALSVRMELADAYREAGDKEKAAVMTKSAITLAEDLVKNPKRLKGYEMTPADAWVVAAEAHEKLGETDAAKAAYKKAVKVYEGQIRALRVSGFAGQERGYNLEKAWCLWKSGDVTQAERLYTTLEQAFPDEFTFYFGHARMHQELKNFAKAEPLAKKAYELSYGDNHLRVAATLAKIQKELGKKDEAKAMIKKELGALKLPEDKALRVHRYAKALEDVQKSL